MHVGVGYSENPDSAVAGRQAALEALQQAGQSRPCDLILLFSTSRHDPFFLRQAVVSVLGSSIPIVGGGAAGAISNDNFGYAGDQVILAAFWLEGVECQILAEGGLVDNEENVGKRLGQRLAELGTRPESPVILFYDAINCTQGDVSLVMATYILNGIEQGLGFLPDLVGAGLQGDYVSTPTKQWTGEDIDQHYALALLFAGDIHVDSMIMHGCRPATDYYTVTKADKQTILEINGVPALQFLDGLLGPSISPDNYAFFLILGVNKGDKWGEFDENNYASRLCLAIDKERSGIVMFEPDMIEGTEFQIMYRSIELDYMQPKIEQLFKQNKDRKPVFAMYINCAGRAAGYGGIDIEDAVMVQKTIDGRVPLLGIYTGVEIASIGGKPQGLDWTGVLCLFSVSK